VCRSLNFTGGCGLVVSRGGQQTCASPDAANDMPDVFGWGGGGPSTRCLPTVWRFTANVGPNRYSFPAGGKRARSLAATRSGPVPGLHTLPPCGSQPLVSSLLLAVSAQPPLPSLPLRSPAPRSAHR
jgi:hypothetical protein